MFQKKRTLVKLKLILEYLKGLSYDLQLFSLNVSDMNQALDYELFLYADGSSLVYQQKEIKEIK